MKMPCCGDREKGGPVSLDEQWDYINLDDFKSESCLTPFSYFFLWVFLLVSIAVYAVDTFTAVTLLAFSRWAGQIEPKIPFRISRWIFAVCIFISFALLAYRMIHAIRAIRSGSIAQNYLNSLAARIQSFRIGGRGRGWRRFLVFAELTSSKKGAEYVALFAYFSFESWLNTIFADGPRQVVNAITLYSVMQMDLLKHAADDDRPAILQFFDNVRILAEENNLRALVLFGMTFTLVIWVLSIIKLALAVVLYLIFLFHHIPAEDGTLTAYCRRKINTRLKRIVDVKVNKALAKGIVLRDQKPANPVGIDRKPTLPTFESDDKMPIVSAISRTTTQTSLGTLPPYASRPGTAPLERQPTLPSLGSSFEKPPLSRTVTQSSSYTDLSGTTAVSGYSPLDRSSPAPPVPPLPGNIPMHMSRSQTPMSRSNSNFTQARGPPTRMGSAAELQEYGERQDLYATDDFFVPRNGTPASLPSTRGPPTRMNSAAESRERYDPYATNGFSDSRNGMPFRPTVDPYTRNMTPGAPTPSSQDSYTSRSFTPGSQNMYRGSPAQSNDDRAMRTFSPVSTRGTPGPQRDYAAYSNLERNTPAPSAGPGYYRPDENSGTPPPAPAYAPRTYTPQPQSHRQDYI